jgi:hypothetical protein
VKDLLEVFDRSCNLCHEDYDLKARTPMMLCLSQHICCQPCINAIIEKTGDGLDCPFCHCRITKN